MKGESRNLINRRRLSGRSLPSLLRYKEAVDRYMRGFERVCVLPTLDGGVTGQHSRPERQRNGRSA